MDIVAFLTARLDEAADAARANVWVRGPHSGGWQYVGEMTGLVVIEEG